MYPIHIYLIPPNFIDLANFAVCCLMILGLHTYVKIKFVKSYNQIRYETKKPYSELGIIYFKPVNHKKIRHQSTDENKM